MPARAETASVGPELTSKIASMTSALAIQTVAKNSDTRKEKSQMRIPHKVDPVVPRLSQPRVRSLCREPRTV